MIFQSNFIPENTPVQVMVLGCRDENNNYIGIRTHVELGPVYNEGLKRNLWLNAEVLYMFGCAHIEITSYDAFTTSCVDKMRENEEMRFSDMMGFACPFCMTNLYKDAFLDLFMTVLSEIDRVIDECFPQHQDDFADAIANSPFYSFIISDTTDIGVDIDITTSDDTDFSISAQAGPLYDSEDDKLLVLFLSSLDYSTLHPDEYTFKHSIMTSYDPADFGETPSGEITEVDEDSDLYEKYADYFGQLETVLMTKLFDTCEDEDALDALSDALDEDGFYDDDEDYDDDDGSWSLSDDADEADDDDEDENWMNIDIFADEGDE